MCVMLGTCRFLLDNGSGMVHAILVLTSMVGESPLNTTPTPD